MDSILDILKKRFFMPFQGLTLAQRVTMVLVFLIAIMGTAAIIKWAVQPDYAILTTDIAPADAQSILDALEAEKIEYKITSGGRGIMVPRKNLYEVRMKLASQNLPANTNLGYEIFDKNDIGVSDFVQQLNYRRALEGELSRTIQSMSEIDKARVHLVFPKERVFKEDQENPSASIFLSFVGRARLREEQIQGIAQLVSGSVEGLDIENVSIIDNHGNVLTKNHKADSITGLSETQLDLQLQLENYLEQKAQTMLDRFLGAQNSIVRVTAELDFRKIEKTNESYDPDNSVVLSEETQTSTSQDSANFGETSTEHLITNYQLTKSIEHIVEGVGNIKRLSVAVLLNDRQVKTTNTSGETIIEYSPRTPEEIVSIETLSRNAIGIDDTRGDQLVVQNMAFETTPWEEFNTPDTKTTIWNKWGTLIQKVIIGIFVIIGYFMITSRFKKGQKSLFGDSMQQLEGGMGDPNYKHSLSSMPEEEEIDFLQEIEKATAGPLQRNEDISNYMINNPSMTAQLIRAWITEG